MIKIEYTEDENKYALSALYRATCAFGWSRVCKSVCPCVYYKSPYEFVCVEPSRWRAAKNGSYYYLGENATTCKGNENGYAWSDRHYNAGNYYRTQKEAEAAAERVRAAFLE